MLTPLFQMHIVGIAGLQDDVQYFDTFDKWDDIDSLVSFLYKSNQTLLLELLNSSGFKISSTIYMSFFQDQTKILEIAFRVSEVINGTKPLKAPILFPVKFEELKQKSFTANHLDVVELKIPNMKRYHEEIRDNIIQTLNDSSEPKKLFNIIYDEIYDIAFHPIYNDDQKKILLTDRLYKLKLSQFRLLSSLEKTKKVLDLYDTVCAIWAAFLMQFKTDLSDFNKNGWAYDRQNIEKIVSGKKKVMTQNEIKTLLESFEMKQK